MSEFKSSKPKPAWTKEIKADSKPAEWRTRSGQTLNEANEFTRTRGESELASTQRGRDAWDSATDYPKDTNNPRAASDRDIKKFPSVPRAVSDATRTTRR